MKRQLKVMIMLVVALLIAVGCSDKNEQVPVDHQDNDVNNEKENEDIDNDEDHENEYVGNVNEDNFLSEDGLDEIAAIESALDKHEGYFKAKSTSENQYMIMYDHENDTFEIVESFSTPSNAANLLVVSDQENAKDKYEKTIDKLDNYEEKEMHGINWIYGSGEGIDMGYVVGMKDNTFYNIQVHKIDYDFFGETVEQFIEISENPIKEDAEIDYDKVLFPSLNKEEFKINKVTYGDGSEEKILRIGYGDNDWGTFTFTVTPESEPIDETYAYRNKVVSKKELKTDNGTNVVAYDFGEYAPTYVWKVDSYTYEIKMDQDTEYDEETILSMINSIK